MICIAVSFLVMILAVAISSGFRREIQNGVSIIAGDIRIAPANMDMLSEANPVNRYPAYLQRLDSLKGIKEIKPVVYRAGIVKTGENIHGVLFKGISDFNANHDSSRMAVSIPSKLARILELNGGDKMTSYFVGDKVKARSFNVVEVYEAILSEEDKLVVYCDLADMQRLNGWKEDEVSAFEITVLPSYRSRSSLSELAGECGFLAATYADDDDASVLALSSADSYPQLFDWLDLIDFNVIVVLILMTFVAGFNMISGLLIMLFEHISAIGLLKSLGMRDWPIAKTFLLSSSKVVLKGMIIGNASAFLLCYLQSATHLIHLSPENYFISFVPVDINAAAILLADLAAYFVIMILLLLPSLFISKVDPARTVRVR